MLQVNQIIAIDGTRQRVLWSSPQSLILIDIDDPKAFPFQREDPEGLLRLIASGDATVVDDPYLAQTMGVAESGSKAEAVRDRGWRIISGIVDGTAILSSQSRGPLIEEAVQRHSTTKQTVYRLLRRYWQRGMTKMPSFPIIINPAALAVKGSPKQNSVAPVWFLQGLDVS